MKKLYKRVIPALLTVLMLVLTVLNPLTVDAKVPYKTYTQNGYGQLVETQTAYTPFSTITKIQSNVPGEDDFELSKPADLKIDSEGNLYIADTDHKRIVICDTNGVMIKELGVDLLKNPTGVFVRETEDGEKLVYVADQEYNAEGKKNEGTVLVFDMEGNVVDTYTKPQDVLYGKNTKFQPQKLIVDKAGNMYVSSKGNTNGVIQISPKNGGTFLGYFATNTTSVTLTQMFLNLVMPEGKSTGILPSSIANIAIDEKGLIYTVTSSEKIATPIKKLNIAGGNLLMCDIYPTRSIAVCVGQHGNIFVGTENGYIFEYTSEGSLLFALGAKDNGAQYRIGLFQSMSAVAVDNNDKLYVLDGVGNTIHIFQPTEFTDLVHDSLDYFEEGKYEESMEPLKQVIQMNGLFDYANMAMGRALFNEEEFDTALNFYRLAKDKDGYSDTYWEIRNLWLNKYVMHLIIGIAAAFIIVKVLKKLDKKKGIFNPVRKLTEGLRSKTLFKQTMYGFKYMRHPFDGTYAVKREGMCSYIAATILGVIAVAIFVINKYFCGFIVKTVKDGKYDIGTDIIQIVAIMIFMSLVTYLICTINDGEGRWKQILIGYVYSFMPYIVLQPIIYLVGMVVTYNEIFIIDFANLIMLVWIVILLFLTIMEINNYSVKETFKVIGLTIFAAFVFILMAVVMYILFAQIIGFITSFGGEVVNRIVGK